MAKYGKSQLKRALSDSQRKGLSNEQIDTLVESLWRDLLKLYNEKVTIEDDVPLRLRNIIFPDVKFGQAIGQGNLIEGDRSISIGQGGNTKSFMELLIGAYPTLAEDQDFENWIPTDRLMALGNGTANNQRSLVFEILKNGFFKFLQSVKIGAHPALGEGETPENGTLQWTTENGLEIWDVDHWDNFSESDKYFRHTQSSPSRVWEVTHNLSKYPSVTIKDDLGDEYEAQINHVSNMMLTITFNEPFSGFADLN